MKKSPTGSFYRHIIRDAWAVVRDNPVLWFFGFFVSFLGNGGVYELLIQGTGRLGLQDDFGGFLALAGILPSGPELWKAVAGATGGTWAVLGIAFVAIVLLAIAVWAVVCSQGGLIQGVRDCARGKKHTFASLFNAGTEVAWPLLALDLLSRLVISAFFYLLMAVLILLLTKITALAVFGYLLAFLLFVPLTIIVGFVTIYAASYMTLYRMRFMEAIESAFDLFFKYWLVSLETAVILFAINVVTALILGLVLGILGISVFLLYGLTVLTTGAAAWILLLVGGTIAVCLVIGTGAGLAAFQYSVWTELFLKLNKGGAAVAKLARWFQKLTR